MSRLVYGAKNLKEEISYSIKSWHGKDRSQDKVFTQLTYSLTMIPLLKLWTVLIVIIQIMCQTFREFIAVDFVIILPPKPKPLF